MRELYRVALSEDERQCLLELVRKGKQSARTLGRAHMLLLAADGKVDAEIAEPLRVHFNTVERTRRRFVEGGLGRALA